MSLITNTRHVIFLGDYKRFRGKGYTFVIPKEWVADTAVELAKAQRQAGTLDYKMGRGREAGVLPDAGAYSRVSFSFITAMLLMIEIFIF